MTKSEAEYQIQVADIHSKKQEITKQTSASMSKMQGEYDIKQQKLIDDHKQAVAKLKARIENAKKLQATAITESSNELKTAQENDANLIAKKCSDDINNLTNISKTFIQKDHNLADSITNLAIKNGDTMMKIESPPMRIVETNKLNSVKQGISQKDSELQNTFEIIYSKIDQMGKNPNVVFAPTDESDSSSTVQKLPVREPSAPPSKQPVRDVTIKEPAEPSSNRQTSRRSNRGNRNSRGDLPKVPADMQKKNIRPIRPPQVA